MGRHAFPLNVVLYFAVESGEERRGGGYSIPRNGGGGAHECVDQRAGKCVYRPSEAFGAPIAAMTLLLMAPPVCVKGMKVHACVHACVRADFADVCCVGIQVFDLSGKKGEGGVSPSTSTVGCMLS